jgi:hypothetical protein
MKETRFYAVESHHVCKNVKKSKGIPVTGLGGP